MSEGFLIRQTNGLSDEPQVLQLRNERYVSRDGRLHAASDMTETFDLYKEHATTFVADSGTTLLGTVRVYGDSERGLPCEEFTNIQEFRTNGRVCEIGHLLVATHAERSSVVLELISRAFIFAKEELHADYVFGDTFVDKLRPEEISKFYASLGFEAVGEPYHDPRFKDSPLSRVIALRVSTALRAAKRFTGLRARVAQRFMS